MENISFSQRSVTVIPTVKTANHSTDTESDWPLIFGAKLKTGRVWIFYFFKYFDRRGTFPVKSLPPPVVTMRVQLFCGLHPGTSV